MNKFLFTALGLFYVVVASATDIQGKVTVMARGGEEPLTHFDNAIVYVADIEQEARRKTVAVMDQKSKRFQPRVLPVIKGQTVEFWNRDRVQHNVFSNDRRNRFDLGRYPKGQFKTVKFAETGQYKIYCNIHRKMIGDIVVVPNRYYAVTDREGNYKIRDVPPGRHQLKVWHIYGGSDEITVQLATEPMQQNFTVVSKKLIREIEQHKNKHDRQYGSYGSSQSGGSSHFGEYYDDSDL